MSFEILRAGLATLVQASSYRGQRYLGMPLAGPADPVAMMLANWLVGNAPDAAALETAYAPFSMRALSPATVAVHGAAQQVQINGSNVGTNRTRHLAAGDVLTIDAPAGGCRSYVAFAGGLGSKGGGTATSTYLPAKIGGFDGGIVPAGAKIAARQPTVFVERRLPETHRLVHGMDFVLRMVVAPESDWVDLSELVSAPRVVDRRADRIGIALDGPALSLRRAERVDSSAVFPGTIQCPPSGIPFLLGPDAQTTGGYPRIAQVIRADRHLIGQLRPGARIRFQRIEPAEAHRLYRSKIGLLRQLQPDARLD